MGRSIFLNGKVFTGKLPLEEAFVVEDGRFLYVGGEEGAAACRTESSTSTDLEGRFVCAGFNDSHMHLLNYGYTLTMVDLREHTSSVEALKARLLEALKDRGGGEKGWLKGRGWNQDAFSGEKRFPTRHDLDQVSTEVPICITRACGHCCVVNSKALALMGFLRERPGSDLIDVDSQGRVLGIFREEAMNLVYETMPRPSLRELKDMLLAGVRKLNAQGITSCQTDDFTAFDVPWEDVLLAYQELKEEGKLTLRVYEQAQLKNTEELKRFLGKGWNTGIGDDGFRIGPLKLVADGSLGSRTACLSRPYQDFPETSGIALLEEGELEELIGYAHANGMQTAVHTIGDGSLDKILAAYGKVLEEQPKKNHRHGLVHCQITRAEQLKRIKEQNLHVYAQPVFLDSDIRIVKERVGEELAKSSYAFHTLKEMGVHVSSGTDCPVERPDPLPCIQCAVTRRSLDGKEGPYLLEERMTVEEALLSYTQEGAYASFEERKKGRIEKGMLADFVVLSQNPFEVQPMELGKLKVCGTYLAGKQVFKTG